MFPQNEAASVLLFLTPVVYILFLLSLSVHDSAMIYIYIYTKLSVFPLAMNLGGITKDYRCVSNPDSPES